MSDREYESTLTFVFIGRFNPHIFSPSWLLNKGIVTEEEAEAAKIEFVHQEVSRFSIRDCTFDVVANRFLARTSHVHLFEKMRDDVYKIFEVLAETPIIQAGMALDR